MNTYTNTMVKAAGLTHGKVSSYTSGCRCTECREALRRYTADLRARRRARRVIVKGRPFAAVDQNGNYLQHGTPSTYQNWGCRCFSCRVAKAADHAPLPERTLK
ncbi:hypothetical protein [Nocardia panacis]|uniref:hypothetical protein n=1 Tax=Nocardia panacis TaxID=2340916 RepID=UPI0013153D68|nr:hypothetical protein [Nocardia panacis]